MPSPARPRWTFAVVSLALFMITLDNLVVTTALPSIRVDLGASIQSLEWTVNAYTLSFAVLLLPAAALGDRFGRRRVFVAGLGLFTLASGLAALAPRAIQGAGGAVIAPLSLTLLADAVPAGKRGLALGAWSGVSGLGVALGPVVGGAVVDGFDWTWIFWLNVPVGLALLAPAARRLRESRGASDRLDLPGLALAAAGLLALTYAAVEAGGHGWGSTLVLGFLGAGLALLVAFVAWERRAPAPMLPLRFFRSRAFAATNAVSLAMYFGVFGSIFFLAQFFQTAQGLSPLEAGLRTLPWTGMPMLVAPLAGLLSDRVGSRPLMVGGLALQATAVAWIASISEPSLAYSRLVVPFVLGGMGMALVFAPAANAVLSAVRPSEAGQASGATNAIREVGGVFGVAVLASVFSGAGSYASPQAFNDGLVAAAWVGAAVLAAGALAALLVPRAAVARAAEPVPVAA
ncbi:MAG: MFS transporter [Actinobacteria bacterium]|nr:MAG: MFS transporter [Actinomycetota bacterium]